jgi:hypothetical protein
MAEIKDLGNYLAKIKASESGGKRYAKNPYGSASGYYQFTKGTFEGLGYDWNDRFDPKIQEEAVTKFTNSNANYLRKNLGIEPNHADLYGAHFLGAVGYKNLYKTSDNRPISDVMSPKEISSNPFVKGKTVGFVKEWLRKKTNTKGSTIPQQEVRQETQYDDRPVRDYYTDSTVNLNQDSGEYMTAPDYEAPSEYEEDTEGNLAKQELVQAQQEQNFIQELQARQEEQQAPQDNQFGYELYVPELPDYQVQQTPSYFKNGGTQGGIDYEVFRKELKRFAEGGDFVETYAEDEESPFGATPKTFQEQITEGYGTPKKPTTKKVKSTNKVDELISKFGTKPNEKIALKDLPRKKFTGVTEGTGNIQEEVLEEKQIGRAYV